MKEDQTAFKEYQSAEKFQPVQKDESELFGQ